MAGSIRCDDTEGRGAIVVQPPLGTVACSGEEGADLDGFDVSYVNGAAPGPCVPVVPIQGFVRAEAGALRLANRPYFALG
ncbi:MAG: hypothetical protein SGI86_22300, partial [Deltaproteobacteria bacterium]|nr:hypothetical protein [Deltaproteobacteria bacterium]